MKRPDPMTAKNSTEFLKRWLEYLKQSEGISFRQLAKAAGVSVAILPLVLAGRRRLTMSFFNKLAPHLRLKDAELSFLRTLLEAENSAGIEKSEQLKKFLRFGSYKEKRPDEYQTLTYLSHWIYPVLRELMCKDTYVDSVAWIQTQLRPGVSQALIRQAREFLIKHEFVVEKKGRFLFPEGKHIVCDDSIHRAALIGFHKQLFQEAAEALDRVPRTKRNVQALTIGLNPQNYQKAVQILEDAIKQIKQLSMNSPDRPDIYSLGFNIFPLAEQRLSTQPPTDEKSS